MKKKILILNLIMTLFLVSFSANAATVINKEDASLFSKKSIYSDVDVKENIVNKDSSSDSSGMKDDDEAINRFTAVVATKTGDTYVNTWSNYKLEITDTNFKAADVYDFYADGIKYDFGIYFSDYSRIAVYYTRLSRDLNVIAANFAPGAPVDDVVIAEETYKHVRLDVPYPFGIEIYNYYFRNVDGKLMVIETYHEDGYDTAIKYIDKFVKAK